MEDGDAGGAGVADRRWFEAEQSRLLREALLARAQAEAAQVRALDAREEADRARVDAERAGERIAFLAEAGVKMAESMDLEATLQAVVHSAVPRIADWSSLTVVDPGGRPRILAVAHEDADRQRLAWELAERYPPDPDAPTGVPRVVRTGELEVLSDITPEQIRAAAQDATHLRLLENLRVRHVATAPLATPTGVLGALTFVLGDSDRRFSTEDLQLITSLAARAALHIQNARLYTERTRIARTLQASLRPPALPAIGGLELAAGFRPAGDENWVGGDFYDVFARNGDGWTAVIGDVAGKGPAAAAITALARHTIRTASRLGVGPAATLTLLNQALYDQSAPAEFCTAVRADLSPREDGFHVRFANGGHPPPLVRRRGGTIELVDSGRGPLLGGVLDVTFHEAELELADGDLLLLYTDGVIELRPGDLAFGEQELARVLTVHGDAPAADLVEAIEQRARELQDGAPRDDIALLAIRAGGDRS